MRAPPRRPPTAPARRSRAASRAAGRGRPRRARPACARRRAPRSAREATGRRRGPACRASGSPRPRGRAPLPHADPAGKRAGSPRSPHRRGRPGTPRDRGAVRCRRIALNGDRSTPRRAPRLAGRDRPHDSRAYPVDQLRDARIAREAPRFDKRTKRRVIVAAGERGIRRGERGRRVGVRATGHVAWCPIPARMTCEGPVGSVWCRPW